MYVKSGNVFSFGLLSRHLCFTSFSSQMSLHKEVLGAYRGLLKAAKAVFKGDKRMQLGARVNAREAFLKNKDEKDEATLQKMIHDAHDAKAFLYHELIQVNYDANKGKHGTFASIYRALYSWSVCILEVFSRLPTNHACVFSVNVLVLSHTSSFSFRLPFLSFFFTAVAKLEPRHLKDNATGKHVSEI